MRRTALTWTAFCIALSLVLGVMLFFTAKMLQFERSMAMAQARAALEENVRLALWRMDSAAAVLMAEETVIPVSASQFNNSNSDLPRQADANARFDPAFQQQMSANEMQLREALKMAPAGDWHKIEPTLLDRISDILPGATLEAVAPGEVNANDSRRLATIPARLVVPASALPSDWLPWNTPLRISLMIAWFCVLLAAAAVARLLGATLSLSERRGAFASAVTHELRTPLTTCRMYAEMLASDMVVEPEARRQYLQTLVAESDRLGHLVENVLTFSRLERHISPSHAQTLSVGELIQRALPALRRRVDQAGLKLKVSNPDEVSRLSCRTDPVAVQQILLNLVDNACKYGRTDIELTLRVHQNRLEICVVDQGAGVEGRQARRLFAAFNKSKTDTVAGIGLGLFLSRRLARELGGELGCAPSESGAVFVLALPM